MKASARFNLRGPRGAADEVPLSGRGRSLKRGRTRANGGSPVVPVQTCPATVQSLGRNVQALRPRVRGEGSQDRTMTSTTPITPNVRGKRCLDVALVVLALPLWLPALGALMLAVALCDGRPIFFPQPRVGRGGHRFVIWKLRSMTREANAVDRRATALGRRLRHHGLDELPQLFNVLVGDMSLVGPRPLEPADLTRLARTCPAFAASLEARMMMAPGLTGLAQICGAHGPAVAAALDRHYAQQWTLGLDLAILVRTAWINLVGKRRGARPLPPEVSPG
jgi:lipopolysaccharide/colanic/teichoic acid biosynthesis glycosyltransferase